MSRSHASSLEFPAAAFARKAVAVRQRCERGRKLILWGWVAAMVGVTAYCRATFLTGADAELLDAVTRTGLLGWASAVLMLGGIGLWLAGNLIYLREVMEASDSEPGSSL